MPVLGQFLPGRSFLHRLDPRLKIVTVVILSMMILWSSTVEGIGISLFLFFLILSSRIPLRHLIGAFRSVAALFILLFLVHLLFTEGNPVPPFPRLAVTVTYEGLIRGAHVLWHLSLLIVSAALMTMTTSPSELVGGLEWLLKPLKILRVPSSDIAIMISLALRFVPTLFEEIEKMKDAQTARCAHFKSGSLIQRVTAVKMLVIPLAIRCFQRGDELALAMEGRGYRRGDRTSLRELRFKRPDYCAMIIVFVFVVWCL